MSGTIPTFPYHIKVSTLPYHVKVSEEREQICTHELCSCVTDTCQATHEVTVLTYSVRCHKELVVLTEKWYGNTVVTFLVALLGIVCLFDK